QAAEERLERIEQKLDRVLTWGTAPASGRVMPPALTERELEIVAQHRAALRQLTAKRELLSAPKPVGPPDLAALRKTVVTGKPSVVVSRTDAAGKRTCCCDEDGFGCECGKNCP